MGNHHPYSDRRGHASRGRLGMTDRELGSVLPCFLRLDTSAQSTR